MESTEELSLDILKFRNIDGIPGLVLAVAQDADTKEVLMVAFTDRDGIEKSLKTGKVHYFSTSRRKPWLKGETSGHFQKIREMYIDCDGDAIVFMVEQTGAACHKGYGSCFYRKFEDGGIKITGKKVSGP